MRPPAPLCDGASIAASVRRSTDRVCIRLTTRSVVSKRYSGSIRRIFPNNAVADLPLRLTVVGASKRGFRFLIRRNDASVATMRQLSKLPQARSRRKTRPERQDCPFSDGVALRRS
jgi:hypothetical protein